MMGNTQKKTLISALVLGLLVGCAGSSVGDSVEKSLEADPQLEESPAFGQTTDTEESDSEGADTEESAPLPNGDAEAAAAAGAAAPEGTMSSSEASRTPEETIADTATDAQDSEASLAGVPSDLKAYIQDLQGLGLLDLPERDRPPEDAASDTSGSPFTQPITRRDYARWLFQANNRLYEDDPGKRLRPGNSTDAPAFKDVPTSDPDFAVIQGLADAGLIPSAFTGNSTAVNFQPDAPLSREALILWKVPLDTRSALPTTSPEAVTEAWGFQDVAKIEPLALRAIAADFQLGDFSNIRRAFGYTTLFRPEKPVTRAEAAATLWHFGTQTDGRSAAEVNARPPQTRDEPPANKNP